MCIIFQISKEENLLDDLIMSPNQQELLRTELNKPVAEGIIEQSTNE